CGGIEAGRPPAAAGNARTLTGEHDTSLAALRRDSMQGRLRRVEMGGCRRAAGTRATSQWLLPAQRQQAGKPRRVEATNFGVFAVEHVVDARIDRPAGGDRQAAAQ